MFFGKFASMKFIILFVSIFLFSCNGDRDRTIPPPIEQPVTTTATGEKLFKDNCSSCHKPDRDFTGPPIQGSLERWPDKKTLFDFIRNPTKVIRTDNYAKKIYDKYMSMMTAFPNLTDTEIQAILDYCDSYKQPSVVN